jgi:hypothetical protein
MSDPSSSVVSSLPHRLKTLSFNDLSASMGIVGRENHRRYIGPNTDQPWAVHNTIDRGSFVSAALGGEIPSTHPFTSTALTKRITEQNNGSISMQNVTERTRVSEKHAMQDSSVEGAAIIHPASRFRDSISISHGKPKRAEISTEEAREIAAIALGQLLSDLNLSKSSSSDRDAFSSKMAAYITKAVEGTRGWSAGQAGHGNEDDKVRLPVVNEDASSNGDDGSSVGVQGNSSSTALVVADGRDSRKEKSVSEVLSKTRDKIAQAKAVRQERSKRYMDLVYRRGGLHHTDMNNSCSIVVEGHSEGAASGGMENNNSGNISTQPISVGTVLSSAVELRRVSDDDGHRALDLSFFDLSSFIKNCNGELDLSHFNAGDE